MHLYTVYSWLELYADIFVDRERMGCVSAPATI